MKYALTSFMGFLLLGCNPGFKPTLVVNANPPNLELINETKNPLFYLVIEQRLSTTTDFENPCPDFQPNLEAKTSVTIPYNEIEGVDEEAEFIWVYWTDCDGLTDFDTFKLYQQ